MTETVTFVWTGQRKLQLELKDSDVGDGSLVAISADLLVVTLHHQVSETSEQLVHGSSCTSLCPSMPLALAQIGREPTSNRSMLSVNSRPVADL